MSFVNPQFFWVMVVPFVIFTFLLSTNKERLSRVFDKHVLKRLSATDESMPLVVRNVLMFMSIFLMIVALARPVKEIGDKKVTVEGLTVLTALDISGSMRSKDVYPNRLEFAKKKLATLLDMLPSDEVGAMAFAHSPLIVSPFSTDKETLKMMISGVDESYINMGSTDFSSLAEQVATLLEKKKHKILILFSDGGDEKAITGFSDILKENDIILYVVLVGTTKGAPVLDENGKPLKKQDGKIAITQRNDALGTVAKETHGAYVIASNGKKDIEELVQIIRSQNKNQQHGEVTVKEKIEYFYYPLAMALLLLLLSLSSLPRKVKKEGEK